MNSTLVATLIDRELQTVAAQVQMYPDDASLCAEIDGLRNPGGNLALHICGNLQHFIGGVLGDSGYVRQRDQEFSRRDLSRQELVDEVATTRAVVAKTLSDLSGDAWDAEYPLDFKGNRLRTGVFLGHLASHLAYHLGQIDGHRRVLTGNAETPPALGFEQLIRISSRD